MALEACVKQILCTLSDSALRKLQSIIDSQKALIQVQITAIQTQLIQYDIASKPVVMIKQAADLAIKEIQQTAGIIPLSMISGCGDLGDFNLNLKENMNTALQVYEDTAYELTRLLSYKEELNALVNDLNAMLDQYTEIRDIMDDCLARK